MEWTSGILIISITAYSGWERLSKMSGDKPLVLCLTARSKKLQEKPLDVQFNSQDFLGKCRCQKSVGLGTWNSQSLKNQEEKDHPQTYEPWTINEAQQDMCYSSRDD